MTQPLTIQGELHLPSAFLQGQEMDVIERQLHGYGLLPVEARARRWRMDADAPGDYVLTFTLVLPEEQAP